jgi:hypothetical protein
MKPKNGATEAFLRAHVNYDGDDCLPWPFCRSSHGHGAACVGGVPKTASRWMCILAHGEPPSPKHEAAHSCGRGNLGCVNPRHLRWATPTENQADKDLHGTHNKGERHGNSKLSADDIIAIRSDGRMHRIIAADYGIARTTVSNIIHKRLWAHIEDHQ